MEKIKSTCVFHFHDACEHSRTVFRIFRAKSGANTSLVEYIDTVTTGTTLDKIKMASRSARLSLAKVSHGQCASMYSFAGCNPCAHSWTSRISICSSTQF